jgi:hypothetical protein
MADALTTISKIINSPPGQLAAGGVLAGIVWKFFERVEAVLKDDTKLEIAVWLLDRKKMSPTFQNWPETFTKVFDRVFGEKHLSEKCFNRSLLASMIVAGITWFYLVATGSSPFADSMKFAVGKEGIVRTWSWHAVLIGFMGLTNVLPDYVSLLGTRYFLFLTSRAKTGTMVAAFVIGDMIVSLVIAFGPSYAVYTLLFADLERAVTLGVESHRLEHVWLMANGTTVGFSKSEVQAIDQYIVAKTQRRDADHNGLLHRISWEFGLREVVLGVAIPCCVSAGIKRRHIGRFWRR